MVRVSFAQSRARDEVPVQPQPLEQSGSREQHRPGVWILEEVQACEHSYYV